MNRTLHIASPLEHGHDVLTVQRELRSFGIKTGTSDGQYGPKTVLAVEKFQRLHNIKVDGIVGPHTWAALAHPSIPKKKPPVATAPAKRPTKPSDGLLFIEEAVKYIGIEESPNGSNNQEFGVWIGVNKVAWCNIFVSYVTFHASNGRIIVCKNFKGHPGVVAKGCTYVPTTEEWFKTDHLWLGRVQPHDGDIPCFNWDGGVPDHIGFAVTEATLRRLVPHKLDAAIAQFGRLTSGEFWTIEGNTEIGNDSNGGKVMIRQRSLSLVDGFGRIKA